MRSFLSSLYEVSCADVGNADVFLRLPPLRLRLQRLVSQRNDKMKMEINEWNPGIEGSR